MLAFNLAYGIVLSMLEDQISALFIGASAGMLWQLRETARAGRWSDAYLGSFTGLVPSMVPSAATIPGRRAARAH
jgi:hypothetical protein